MTLIEPKKVQAYPYISLAAIRVNANLSQAGLAERLGVDRQTILNWENGYTRIDTPWLCEFAKNCNDFPVDYIFLPSTSTKSRQNKRKRD